MRVVVWIFAAFAAVLPAGPGLAQEGKTPPPKDSANGSAERVKELRKERIAVLKDLTEIAAALYKNARAPMDELLVARQLLAEAELDAAETEVERVRLLTSLVAGLKEFESWADERFKSGRANQIPVFKAKAKRLEAEIRLEQAKMRAAKAK